MKILTWAIALAGLSAAAPMAAEAAAYQVVYDGKITAGFDTDGLFGTAGQDLTGLGIRASISYLTSIPGTRTTTLATATTPASDELAGGIGFGTAPVITSALFTIGTRTAAMFPDFYDDVYTSATFLDAYGYDQLGNSFQINFQPNAAGPVNLERGFSSDGVGDTGSAVTQGTYLSLGADLLDFNATHVGVLALPEPASWAMMILGVGAIGCATRRRRDGRIAALAG